MIYCRKECRKNNRSTCFIWKEGISLRQIRTFSTDEALVNERRTHIVNSAADIFYEKGYHGTTLPEILKVCHMSAGAIYHYVGSKDDILYLVMVASVERVRKRLLMVKERCRNHSATDTLVEFIKELVRIEDDEQDSAIMLNRDLINLDRGARRILLDAHLYNIALIETILQDGIKSAEFEIKDTFLVAHTIVQEANSWALQRWYLRTRYTLTQFTNYLVEQTMKIVTSRDTQLASSN